MHLARGRARRRIHGGDIIGQVRGLALGSHDELPAQPLPPVHVHDHPRGELAGQQPGTALQGHRLAVGGVLQEQPGRGRDQVVAVDHGLHEAARAVGAGYRNRIGRLVPARFPAGHAGHHHEQVAVPARPGQAGGQLCGRRSLRMEQAALDPPGPPGPRDRGELALHRGPGGEVHERGEELPGRVAGPGPEQLAGPVVDSLHGGVRAEQEHRHGRVLEHGAQQPPLRDQRLRARAGGLSRTGGGSGPHRAEHVDGGVQLRERSLQHSPGIRPGHGCGLPQPGEALLERGHLEFQFRWTGGLRHRSPIAAGDDRDDYGEGVAEVRSRRRG